MRSHPWMAWNGDGDAVLPELEGMTKRLARNCAREGLAAANPSGRDDSSRDPGRTRQGTGATIRLVLEEAR